MLFTSLACEVPVTALKLSGSLLYAGEGPNICTYKWDTGRKLSTCQFLVSERVHGILEKDNGNSRSHIGVFGGKSCVVAQSSNDDSTSTESLELLSRHTFDDWILTAKWLEENQIAVALGHNVVSLWDWKQNQVICTVHSEEKCILYPFVGAGRGLGQKHPEKYSAHFIGQTWEDLILAAGTVFNQVVLWGPATEQNAAGRHGILHRLKGHSGVIFAVEYNTTTKQLCSVSDDRSIIIWKLEFGDSGSNFSWQQASFVQKRRLFGHTARVWRVKLLDDGHFVSVGEDSLCIVWNQNAEIQARLKGHKGKSIWSLDADANGVIATGGGDCGVRVWKMPGRHTDSETEPQLSGWRRSIKPNCLKEFSPKTVRLFGSHCVVVMSSEGILHCYHADSDRWTVLLSDEGHSSYSLVEVSLDGKFLAVCNITGDIAILDQGGVRFRRNIYSGKVFSIVWLDSDDAANHGLLTTGPDGKVDMWNLDEQHPSDLNLSHEATFQLPLAKHRWVSTGCLIQSEAVLICGDRSGSLHLYQIEHEASVHPVQSFRSLHGKAGVTHVLHRDGRVHSTGRDGVHRTFSIQDGQLHLLTSAKVLKGLDWISRLWITEDDFRVLGFHTTNFIVHSVDRNQTLLSVPCGGGHRSWDFSQKENRTFFTHIKSSELVLSEYRIHDKRQLVLKESLHGKELTCVRHLHSTGSASTQFWVTASEDTDINVVGCTDSEVQILLRMKGHISSVRALAVTACDKDQACPTHMVFSGGGRAQLKVWKVYCDPSSVRPPSVSTSCPVWFEQQGMHMLGHKSRKERKLAKFQLSLETRYMDLSAFPVSCLDAQLRGYYAVAAACSDGSVRLFWYDEQNLIFHLVAESRFHDHCVLCVKHIIHKEAAATEGERCRSFIFSSATDGKIAFWDATDLLLSASRELVPTATCASEHDAHPEHGRAWNPQPRMLKSVRDLGDPLLTVAGHQSGINAVDAYHVGGNEYLIASGGDDNSLGLHTVSLGAMSAHHENSFYNPTAHSTQITGVKILDGAHVVSSSIDQRLSVWEVDAVTQKMSLVGSKFIYVADVSSLDVEKLREGHEFMVAVVGVGLQTVRISLPSGHC